MSVLPKDFLDHAAKLAGSEDEIDWRNCVSRAYYAAYHRASQSVDLCPTNDHIAMGSHERLAERFKLHGATGAKAIALVLCTMKRQRHFADYEIEDNFDRGLANTQVEICKTLNDRLAAFDNTYKSKSA